MKNTNVRYKNINSKIRYKEVNKIVKVLKFENMTSLHISDIKKLEVYFKEYRINCVDESGDIIYKDSYIEKPKCLYIWLLNNHFHLIISINSFYNVKNFCDLCLLPYNKNENHICKSKCKKCLRKKCHVKLKKK